jgi:ABC-type sugar transport system, permease component
MMTKLTTRLFRKSELNSISNFSNIVFNIMFILISVVFLAPLLLVLSASFTPEKLLLRQGYKFIPKQWSLDAYQYILMDFDKVIRAYGISIFVTVAGTVASVLIIAMLAYPLSRKDFRFRSIFSFIVFFTMLFNGGLVPTYLLYSRYLHLRDTLLILIIPLLVSPFYVLIMKTFFSSNIHLSIIEAARMDGAGELRTFFSIVMPLSSAGLATIALFSTIGYWNDWYTSMIYINNNRLVSLQYLMYKVELNISFLSSAQSSNFYIGQNVTVPDLSARMAMCIIGVGPIVLAYPFFQRYFIKGLTIGSIKG